MAKRVAPPAKPDEDSGRRSRARAALDAVMESVHEDNRVLEGEELVQAVYEIFKVVRPQSSYKETK